LREEVSVYFACLDGYSPSLHDNLLTLQPYFLAAQQILHRSGAFIRQFLVDDKGCVLIAMWGMPGLSYPDNAVRAVSAAANVNITLRKLGSQHFIER